MLELSYFYAVCLASFAISWRIFAPSQRIFRALYRLSWLLALLALWFEFMPIFKIAMLVGCGITLYQLYHADRLQQGA